MKTVFYCILNSSLLLVLWSCNTNIEAPITEKADSISTSTPPPNIIFLIGDGMGHSQLSTVFYFKKDAHLGKFPVVGISHTKSASDKITDSAAGATAFASGKKTTNGFIGMNSDEEALPLITDILSERGYNTGIVSTSSITHATPAAYYAHISDRDKEFEIATFLPNSNIDFFAGSGLHFFRNNEIDPAIFETFEKQGFAIDTTSIERALPAEKKHGFIIDEQGLPQANKDRGDLLSKMAIKAIEYLSQQDAPYFLMIESSQIDWAGHNNDAEYLIAEMLDFDKVIGDVISATQSDKNTLIVVTADHETGGYSLSSKLDTLANGDIKKDYNVITPTFSTPGHSAASVPVLARGRHAENFNGIYQNTSIFKKILDAAK